MFTNNLLESIDGILQKVISGELLEDDAVEMIANLVVGE
jgi:hypothetical protein